MSSVQEVLASMWRSFLSALPDLVAALVWIAAGVLIALLVGKILRRVVHSLIEVPLAETGIGRSLVSAGLRISAIAEFLVEAFIISISITIAFAYLKIPGEVGAFIHTAITYLPRVVVGLIVLVLGLIFAVVLVKYISTAIRETFSEPYKRLAVLVEDILFIGLLAVIVTVALEVMGITAQYVYSLVLGALIMILGVMVSIEAAKVVEAANPKFEKYSETVQLMLLVTFVIGGLAAMFAQYPVVGTVLAVLAVGVALGFGFMLAYTLYTSVKSRKESA